MIKKILGPVLLVALFAHASFAQQEIRLYPPNQIPFAKPGTEEPRLTVFMPAVKKTDIAVIVCSGGSYGGRANDWEGIPACKKLNEAGITAFLLDYRLPDAAKMDQKQLVPLTDVQSAIVFVREHAKRYGVNAGKTGLMGFSAGGHLVTTAGTHFDTAVIRYSKNISVRPDFVIAVYPVVSFADSLTHKDSRNNLIGPHLTAENIRTYSNEWHVTGRTPPFFLVSALDDEAVPVGNSLYFSAALRQHRIPTEIFLYAKGGHGFGVDHIKNIAVQWTEPCFKWLLSEPWNAPNKK